ncbi:MAG: GNAT family N-acetyltransferase [Promethearchaeota archaeon]
MANSPNDMRIREAEATDSEWVLHHRIGMFRDMGESEEFLSETEKLTRRFLEGDWAHDYRYFLVEEGQAVIGGCGLSTFMVPPGAHQRTGLFGYLSNMYIEPEFRRKGIGRALMKHVVEFCLENGIGLLLLHASDEGRYLYESEGFSTPKSLMHLITWKYTGSS